MQCHSPNVGTQTMQCHSLNVGTQTMQCHSPNVGTQTMQCHSPNVGTQAMQCHSPNVHSLSELRCIGWQSVPMAPSSAGFPVDFLPNSRQSPSVWHLKDTIEGREPQSAILA